MVTAIIIISIIVYFVGAGITFGIIRGVIDDHHYGFQSAGPLMGGLFWPIVLVVYFPQMIGLFYGNKIRNEQERLKEKERHKKELIR